MINRIVHRISTQLKPSDRNTDQAIMSAAALMNESMSDTEKKAITEFSKQLEPVICPNFKTIHDESTTVSIWTIAHWLIKSHLLIVQLTELINQHGESDYQIKTEFNDTWMISLIHYDKTVGSTQLNQRYGLPLIKEIMEFIFQNVTMPE